MAVNPSASRVDTPTAFELKASSFTLPIIRLLVPDMEAVADQLGAKVDQAPDFFRNTPVVIDLSSFPADAGNVEFPLLVGLLRGYGMIPFGVRGGTKANNSAAEAMELAILSDAHSRSARSSAPQAKAPPADPCFTLVTRPVRSGQRIYATDGDLSVVGPVSSGAELMADGNIHVYGPLRGRALAGMKGSTGARIFCQDLQAELVSVAGHYRVSDNIPSDLRNMPVQIYLEQNVLRIEKL